MPLNDHRASRYKDDSRLAGIKRASVSSRLDQFEKRQSHLWRLTFLLLLVLSIVFAVISWDAIRALSHRLEALPIGLVILVALFGIYAWKRTQEISELRGLVRGMEQPDAEPSDKQLNQLFQVIEKSQQGYRDLIDSFDDVLVAVNLDGQIRAVNRTFADLTGHTFQEIIGHPISEFLEEASDEGSGFLDRVIGRLVDRRHWSGVVQVRLKPGGAIYYFDCVAHAIARNDQVHGITVLARDISTERKNEARFTELFETLQEGIYITTPAGAILDANPALVRMLGYDFKEELLARTVPDIFQDRSERKSVKVEVERQPMLQGREITLIRKDGLPIVCLNTAAAVRDASGKVLRYQGALMDITSRREMERRLHQQQEFARRLIDSFPDLILVLDTEGKYTFISARISEILGFEPEEAMRGGLGDRTHPEDRAALHALYQEITSGRQTFGSLEVRVRHKQGGWRRIRSHFSPLSNESGKVDGVIISGRDVTDLKRLEEQLLQAEKLAAMGQMLAGVAHELNNPLTAILGVTELLREREGLDDSVKRQLELTHRQARRAARIVQNLLEFSRPASPQKKPVDLNSVIERTIQLQEHSLRRNNVAVEFHSQPHLPQVVGDGNQLIQVFLNLLTNAEQAIREVRDQGNIHVRIVNHLTRIAVIVQDDGVGIRPEALPRIFDPFYTSKRPGGGTGLGLSISTSIVREHGGSLEADVVPTGGSMFTVYLPVVAAALQVAPAASGDAPALDTPGPGNEAQVGRSILVLDDEESIRLLLEEGLSARGLRVDCAANVDAALALVARRPYDVLLCDLNIKSANTTEDGHSAADRVAAASGANPPFVIFMTGDFAESASRAADGSLIRCLQKPFRISDVIALLGEISFPTPAGHRKP